MTSPVLIIEIRPRLQVAHVFVKDTRVESIDLEAGSMTLYYHAQQAKVTLPGLDLKCNSVSNFTHLEHGEGTYFRVQTGRCTPLQLSTGLLDYSTKNTSYIPHVQVEKRMCVECVCCCSVVVEELSFQRILPLPSDSWDASEMFCHVHGAPPSITARSGDLLYGPYNFILPVHTTSLINVNIGIRVLYCEVCNAWLGTRAGGFYTLWNSTVKFVQLASPGRNETRSRSTECSVEKLRDDKEKYVEENNTETDAEKSKDNGEVQGDGTSVEMNKVKKIDKERKASDENVVQRVQEISLDGNNVPNRREGGSLFKASDDKQSSLKTPQLIESKENTLKDKQNYTKNFFSQSNNKSPETSEERSLRKIKVEDSQENPLSPRLQQSLEVETPHKRVTNSHPNSSTLGSANAAGHLHQPSTANNLYQLSTANNLHQPSTANNLHQPSTANNLHQPSTANNLHQPSLANNLHQTGLHDFINVVRDNIGINSKILIHCQVSDSSEQYLLLWVMDRNLSLCTWRRSTARMFTVMKVLYSYAKDTPSCHWENDLSLAQVSVSKRMFLSAVQHIREQERNIPAPFRCISEMQVSYLVLD